MACRVLRYTRVVQNKIYLKKTNSYRLKCQIRKFFFHSDLYFCCQILHLFCIKLVTEVDSIL